MSVEQVAVSGRNSLRQSLDAWLDGPDMSANQFANRRSIERGAKATWERGAYPTTGKRYVAMRSRAALETVKRLWERAIAYKALSDQPRGGIVGRGSARPPWARSETSLQPRDRCHRWRVPPRANLPQLLAWRKWEWGWITLVNEKNRPKLDARTVARLRRPGTDIRHW